MTQPPSIARSFSPGEHGQAATLHRIHWFGIPLAPHPRPVPVLPTTEPLVRDFNLSPAYRSKVEIPLGRGRGNSSALVAGIRRTCRLALGYTRNNLWHSCQVLNPPPPPIAPVRWGLQRWTASRSPERLSSRKSNQDRIAFQDTIARDAVGPRHDAWSREWTNVGSSSR